jgi:hypothetical protein
MSKRIMTTVILLVGLLTASCTAKELNDNTMADGLVTIIPFKLHGSMILVELVVDGSDPLTFIFDTAADITAISARTADRLGIIGDETVSGQGAGGDAPIVLSEKHTISIGDLILQDVTLGIAEWDHIDRRLGMRIDGAIGGKILSQYAVRLNYDTMQIEIYDTERYKYSLNAQGFDVEVKGMVFFVNTTVAFESGAVFTGKVLVDTGAGSSFSFNTPFSKDNDLLAEIGSNYEREIIAGLSIDSFQIVTTMLSSLIIGSYEFVSIPANIAFAEAGALSWPEVMGILGNETLMRFNMFIDLQQKRIFLEPNQLYHEAFEVNCSGLELVMDDTFEKVIVDYIYTGSPAEKSGIMVGDEIIQIDMVSATDLQLPQIRSMLSQDGQEVDILVSREDELYSYRLKLRALISLGNGN